MRLAIFASGSGSNAEAIVRYLHDNQPERGIRVACIITNKSDAYVLERAKRLGIPARYLTSDELRSEETLLPILQEYGVSHIVLAGYLALIPKFLLEAFPQRIVNIHPALLPKYGGKGCTACTCMRRSRRRESVRRESRSMSSMRNMTRVRPYFRLVRQSHPKIHPKRSRKRYTCSNTDISPKSLPAGCWENHSRSLDTAKGLRMRGFPLS